MNRFLSVFHRLILVIALGIGQHASASDARQTPAPAAHAQPGAKWLFYEVKRDKTLVAYLFGAVHHPIGKHKIPDKVFTALEKSRRVEFEWNFFDQRQASESSRLLTANPGGAQLSAILSPQTQRSVQDLYALRKIPAEHQAIINSWTPFMAVLTLGAPCTRFTADGAAPERVIYEFAKLAEVPIGEGLEDAEAQLGRLSTLSREQWDSYVNAHLAWLKDGRCNERFLGNIHRMWANLLEGDADAMYEEYMRFYTEVVPARWFQHDYFVTVRNGPMVEKMVRLVTPESPVFFSVGAIHLAGPEGIVALLQQRGYQVEQK